MFEHHYHNMILKDYSFTDIHDLLKKINLNKFISTKCLLGKHLSIYIKNLVMNYLKFNIYCD